MTDALGRLTAALAGRYDIRQQVGQGGMATVYLAQDIRHDRKVALKILRPELAAILGGERFLKEIRTTANLQHPHILPLHDSGDADGTIWYTMPFIDGESLRDRLDREKQLPVDEAVRIAREVAGALDYAHRHGVVHRDIKPENVLLHDGQALVADFGIALAAARTDGGTRMTETGMSLGTPHYMSPEQAMGEKDITPKADIYALGCVTYEMLTGEPPYTGPTAQAIIARVMTEQPRSLSLQRHTIPPHVDAAVRMALEKLPADRFASAALFAEALARPSFTTETAARPAPGDTRHEIPAWRSRRGPAAAGALALGVAGFLLGRVAARPAPLAEPSARFVLDLPDSARYLDTSGPSVAVSPDGTALVYPGGSPGSRRLFLRRFDALAATPIPGTEGGYMPFFSPDGQWLGFSANQRLMKVRLGAGSAVTIAQLQGNQVAGATWGPTGVIVLEDVTGLSRVNAAGGQLQQLTTVDSVDQVHEWPTFLPDGETVLFTSTRVDGDRLAMVSLATGRVTVLDSVRGAYPRYLEPGWLTLLSDEGSVVIAPFSARTLRVGGPFVPIIEQVASSGGAAKLGITSRVAVHIEGGSVRSRLLLLDRRGRAQSVVPDELAYQQPRLSPDGRRIAVAVNSPAGVDVWVVDRQRKTRQRLTFGDGSSFPEWSGDGRRIAYGVVRGSIDVFWATADGAGVAESLVTGTATQVPYGITPDNSYLVYADASVGSRGDIHYLRIADRTSHRFVQTPSQETAAALSPDGRWMAYVSDESGRREVYVRPFPAGDGRWQVSVEGGVEPRWSRAGREILYRSGDYFLAVPVSTRPSVEIGRVDTLFQAAYTISVQRATYDVSRDGETIVIVGTEAPTSRLIVTFNPLSALPASGR